MADRPRKDRVFTARKAQMELEQVKEAEMEARVLGMGTRTVDVVCPHCKQRSQFELRSGVPVAQCPVCGMRLPLNQPANPQVVSR